ncbi:MAG: DUF523 domain-containing protein [Deltaproteobacteria bacterium]|nr:DUF523 domain-containing protein [Deltaproteobacteria bacterium]
MDVLLVAACLLGRPCRYDGAAKTHAETCALAAGHEARGGKVVAVCPEELGGLGTPRPAAELRSGDGHAVLHGRARVRRVSDGADVTGAFVAGAERARELGRGASRAVLKARSPSCGCGSTWIDGALGPGDGVLAALLRRDGVAVGTEDDILAPA